MPWTPPIVGPLKTPLYGPEDRDFEGNLYRPAVGFKDDAVFLLPVANLTGDLEDLAEPIPEGLSAPGDGDWKALAFADEDVAREVLAAWWDDPPPPYDPPAADQDQGGGS